MLTIDIGNTSIKWAIWQDDQPILAESARYDNKALQKSFDDIFSGAPQEEQAWVASVSSKDIEQALTKWLKKKWSITPVFLKSTREFGGVQNAYPDAEQLGVDRWAALLGARSLYSVPVCIVDIGTAVTVDLMDADGVHRGGRIMPGIDMMKDALKNHTVGITEVDGDNPWFAINTADAVSSGTFHMLQAALEEIYDSARARLGTNMKMVITGGNAEKVIPHLVSMETFYEPHIVLRGLYYASEQ